MTRTKGKPKDPQQYLKWQTEMVKKYGQEVFTMFDIALPDDFETLRSSEQDAVNNDVGELLRRLNLEYKTENEDFIASSGIDGFLTEEDWRALNNDAPMTAGAHHYKMFQGKNYSLEFVRMDSEIHFHLYYPSDNIEPRQDVYERFEEIMTPIIPRHWKVSMSFERSVMPHNAERASKNIGDYPTCCSYIIHFVGGALEINALHYLKTTLKAFLQQFIMPQHYMSGMSGGA